MIWLQLIILCFSSDNICMYSKVNNSAAYQLYDDDKYDAYKLPLIDENYKR